MTALLLALFFQAAHAHPKISIPDAAPDSCKKFINETLPKHWSGGFMQVPLDWRKESGPSNPVVHVFYYYDDSRDLKLSQPILFLRGGPFGHAQPNVRALDQQVQMYDTSKQHTLVVIDQRGTGCSFPLVRNPLPQTEAELAKISLDVVRLHSADDIVKDAEHLRNTLFGSKKWKVFGQSFGGAIVHRYLYSYPSAISSAHSHAPSVHSSWEEFARLRLLAQQEVLAKFLEHYQGRSGGAESPAQKAIDILHSEAGKQICLARKGLAPEICGKPLMDAVLGDIGQGPSSSADSGKYENWDAVHEKLLMVAQGNIEGFKAAAEKSMDSFFRNDRSLIAFASWSQDMPMHADLDRNCLAAYENIRAEGIDPTTFGLDECRIILNAIAPAVKKKLAAEFRAGPVLISQEDIVRMLRKSDAPIPYYVYSGKLDFFGQSASIQTLIQASDVVQHHEFSSGHGGWAFEPLLWRNLIDAP